MDLAIGSEVVGKYRIDGTLGKGGMGVVYAAFHQQLEQRVAIKVMRPEAVERQGGVLRFVREARAAARITSEHVARVFDVGTLENGQPYMVMEFMEGFDVAAAVAARGRFKHDVAVGFILQACDALAEAHAVGIVHRDLKPANLFLVRRVDGTEAIKVLDFGISKVSRHSGEQSDDNFTNTSSLMGSPLYMSPEQLRSSRDVDLRTDIWSLGVVLYQMLTGSAPFNGATLPQVCENVRGGPIEPPSALARGVPPALDRIVLRCLERRLEQRYQSVADLARALAPFATAGAQSCVTRILRLAELEPGLATQPSVAPAQHTSDAPWVGRSPLASDTRPASRKWLWFAIAAVLGAPCGYVLSHRRVPVNRDSYPSASVERLRAARGVSDTPLSAPSLGSPRAELSANSEKLPADLMPIPKPSSKVPLQPSRSPSKLAVSGQAIPAASVSGAPAPRDSAVPAADRGLGQPGSRSRL